MNKADQIYKGEQHKKRTGISTGSFQQKNYEHNV
jgi:hypothetical protein